MQQLILGFLAQAVIAACYAHRVTADVGHRVLVGLVDEIIEIEEASCSNT